MGDSRFGVTDLGPLGITTFFSNHICSPHCREKCWYKPEDNRPYLEPTANTVMINMLQHGGIHGLPSEIYMDSLVKKFKKLSTTIPWSTDGKAFSPPGRSDNNTLVSRSTA